MDLEDVERIARHALRELGAGDLPLTVVQESRSDRWRLDIGGPQPVTLTIRAGPGTSAQFVRDQIFEQFSRR